MVMSVSMLINYLEFEIFVILSFTPMVITFNEDRLFKIILQKHN